MALPTALAIALICSPLSGFAQDATRDSVQEQLNLFSAQQTVPGATVKFQAIATTPADNLVYAVYDAVRALGPDATQNAVAAVVTEALNARKDKDKLAGRVVAAAIAASGRAADPAYVSSIVTEALNVSGLKTAGKALAVSAALRFSTPTDAEGAANSDSNVDTGAAIGAAARGAAASAGGVQAFALAVLKVQGNNPNNVPEFVDSLLEGALNDGTAINLARGLATQPAVAGAVIGARAADISGYTPGSANTAVTALLNSVVTDAKLAKAVTEAIAQTSVYYTDDAPTLAGTLAANNKKVAGAVAAGFLRAPDANVDVIVEKTIASGTVVGAQFATFAAQAAVGVGENSDELTTALLNRRSNQTGTTADKANIIKIAAAVANTVGVTDPVAAQDVGAAVANATLDTDGSGPGLATEVYAQGDLAGLATSLAKAVNKNYTASGAVVAGVVSASTDQSIDKVVEIADAGTIGNAKAAAGITLQVATSRFTGIAEIQDFAVKLALRSKATNGAQIALGAAIASPSEPGEVVKAIANLPAQQKSVLKIATAVAAGVDIEAISDVTEKVATLFGTTNTALPKLSSLTALATSMVKAINAKPVAPKATQVVDRGTGASLYANFSQFNRVDEIGEVAASLVNAALGAGSTDAKLIGAIGTSIFKAVSQKLFADTGLNLADIKDVAQDVAGAIFQTISVSDRLSDAQKAVLLNNSVTDKTTLLAFLSKGAGVKYTELVRTALAEVNGVGIGNFVPGGENQDTTKYEVGAVIESETPVVNL